MKDFTSYKADLFHFGIMVNLVAAMWELAFQNSASGDERVVSEIASVMKVYSRLRFHEPVAAESGKSRSIALPITI